MTTFLYVLLAIVVLLFMVMVHELGHYIAGKILKFKITEFSIGFGKAIFSHTSKKTGEKFSLRIFPLGGYCSFYGEDDDGSGEANDKKSEDNSAVVEVKENVATEKGELEKSDKDVIDLQKTEGVPFNSQKPWKRIIVFLAGVTMNFITAILFSWILLCTVGYDVPQIINFSQTVNVVETSEGTESIFQKGDVITHINGQKIDFAFGVNFTTAISEEKAKAEEFYKTSADGEVYTFEMTVRRNGESVVLSNVQIIQEEIEITNSDTGEVTTTYNYLMGLESTEDFVCIEAHKYGFFEGLGRAFSMAFGFAWVVLKSLWLLITFQIPITEMGGTITTIATMAEYTAINPANILIFIPLISANLAIFNLLPFPALDGAHVLFTVIEWIRGKPINRKVENTIHFVGICILFAFVVLVDILHFVL